MANSTFAYEGKEYTEDELVKIAKEKYGIKIAKSTLDTRLRRQWSVERAISTPTNKRVKKPTEAHKIKVLRRAQKKYLKNLRKEDPNRLAFYQTRSYARMYLSKYATLEELNYYQKIIEKRIQDLKNESK